MKTILTKEGRVKIQEELNFLLTTEKNRVIADLADARESGPLEENTQYLVAKDEYEKVNSKIEKLQYILSNATIVESSDINTDTVTILTSVKVLNTKSNKEFTFSIVPENEIDSKLMKISINSPIGSSLIGKKVDDICQVNTPNGLVEFKILEISL